MTRRDKNESGSSAVELVLMVPVMMTLVLSVVAGGRYVDSRGQVNDAAYAAARAASLAPTLDSARQAGQQAAQESLADRGKACTTLTVSFAGTDFTTGGYVTAEVTCHADLSDVVGFGLPGAKSFTATAVVPIEQARRLP